MPVWSLFHDPVESSHIATIAPVQNGKVNVAYQLGRHPFDDTIQQVMSLESQRRAAKKLREKK
jgi:hypothetical protein